MPKLHILFRICQIGILSLLLTGCTLTGPFTPDELNKMNEAVQACIEAGGQPSPGPGGTVICTS